MTPTDMDRDEPEARGVGGPDAETETRSPSRRRMVLVALVVLAVAGGLALALLNLRPGPQRAAPEVVPPVVEVVEAHPQRVRYAVSSQGSVQPVTESVLAAQVAGRVVAVSPNLREGGFFARGDVLVTLDPEDYRLALRDAEATVEQARARFERVAAEAAVAREELALLGAAGEASPLARFEPQLAEARSGVQAALATLERARLALERTTIEAPYDGRVRARQVDVGQVVSPGAPVASVFGTEAAEVRLPISKEDAAFLAPGVAFGGPMPEDLSVVLEGELGGEVQRWEARLVRASGEIAPQTRMLGLFARVEDPYRRRPGAAGPVLPMGLYVTAEIPGRELEGVYSLPREALSVDGDLRVVAPDGRLRIREVEILRTSDERVVVGSGLAPGDRVVVSRLETVTEGMRVRVAGEASDEGPAPPVAPAAEGEPE